MRLALALLAVVIGCSSPAVPMRAAPHVPPPPFCVQAITADGELVVACAETERTCNRARLTALQFGGGVGIPVVGDCYRRPK